MTPATIVECSLPAANFALNETCSRLPNAKFEVLRVVAHDDERVLPLVWVTDEQESLRGAEAALEADRTVANARLLTDLGDARLYQMEWVEAIETLVRILVDEAGVVLNASGHAERWFLRVLFPDRAALSRTYDYCEDHGLAFDIERIYELDESRKGQFGLSEAQQETLVRAYELGYYAVPRGCSLEDLAEELDVSHQALSERFRRGHEALIANTLVIGPGYANAREAIGPTDPATEGSSSHGN